MLSNGSSFVNLILCLGKRELDLHSLIQIQTTGVVTDQDKVLFNPFIF